MTDKPGWPPHAIDTERPSVARMYDWLLGGCHNFAADRAAVARAVTALPWLPAVAQANRAFLRRAVRYLAARGVEQFLDLGSGIPTVGNVHQIAQRACPGARTVYVDHDPVAVAHARALLHDDPNSDAIGADLRHPDLVLAHPAVRALIDWTRPVGVLMVAVLHFIPDGDDPAAILAEYRNRMAPGSYLASSHASREGQPADVEQAIDEGARAYEGTGTSLVFRDTTQLDHLMAGFTLVPPGIVAVPDWRPEPEDNTDPARWRYGLACVGQVPGTAVRGLATRHRNFLGWNTDVSSRASSSPAGTPVTDRVSCTAAIAGARRRWPLTQPVASQRGGHRAA